MNMVKETFSREKTHILKHLLPRILSEVFFIEAVKWNFILLFLKGEKSDMLSITLSSVA